MGIKRQEANTAPSQIKANLQGRKLWEILTLGSNVLKSQSVVGNHVATNVVEH